MDKLVDKEKDLKTLCEGLSDDFLKGGAEDYNPLEEPRVLISSKPYIRKNNLISEKAVVKCWEAHYRFNRYDIYCSIMRRSYIAPIMDTYQDITVCSKVMHGEYDLSLKTEKKEEQCNKDSFQHLEEVHRKIIDSIRQTQIASTSGYFKIFM